MASTPPRDEPELEQMRRHHYIGPAAHSSVEDILDFAVRIDGYTDAKRVP